MSVFDNILRIFCCASHADVAPAAAEKDVNVVLCRSDSHVAEYSEGQNAMLEALDGAGKEGAGCAEVELTAENKEAVVQPVDEKPAGCEAVPFETEPAPSGRVPGENADDLGVLEEIARYAERMQSEDSLLEGGARDKALDTDESLDGILEDHIAGQRNSKLFGPVDARAADCTASLPGHRPENILDSAETVSDDEPVNYNGFFLPPQTGNKPTLVLDLDHTLVFPSNKKPDGPSFDVTICLDGQYQQIWVVERPYLREFLDALHLEYELVVFTAGIGEYGRAIVSQIDRDGRIAHVLHRRHCTPLEHSGGEASLYVKDLSRLGRDLRRTIIVDDREYSFLFNFANGQFIPPFTGDSGDSALLRLREYLLECLKLPDFSNRQCLGYE